ncbi:MAG: Uma2 family endonuclease [Isosphaerales bacterium]
MATIYPTAKRIPPASETDIDYPDSDGKPLGETGVHVSVTLGFMEMLIRYYANNRMVALHSNMFVYYALGDPKQNVCPDLMVALDVPYQVTRRSYKVWNEGKGPDLVLEVTSRKTRREDLGPKFELYRDVLKVREYFLFDPLEEYLEPSFQGFRLARREYKPITMEAGRLPSEVLGLHLERDEIDLRLYNPRTGLRIPTGTELQAALRASKAAVSKERAARRKEEAARKAEEAARKAEEAARKAEEDARRTAESELEQLRRENDILRKRLAEDS